MCDAPFCDANKRTRKRKQYLITDKVRCLRSFVLVGPVLPATPAVKLGQV
jgi:hypothetical protein